jgi:hypothetical protein
VENKGKLASSTFVETVFRHLMTFVKQKDKGKRKTRRKISSFNGSRIDNDYLRGMKRELRRNKSGELK